MKFLEKSFLIQEQLFQGLEQGSQVPRSFGLQSELAKSNKSKYATKAIIRVTYDRMDVDAVHILVLC